MDRARVSSDRAVLHDICSEEGEGTGKGPAIHDRAGDGKGIKHSLP